jgi:hypothetical protein
VIMFRSLETNGRAGVEATVLRLILLILCILKTREKWKDAFKISIGSLLIICASI